MKGKRTVSFWGVLLLAPLLGWPQNKEKTISLSLDECILKAMRNNLGVAVQVLNPRLRETVISLAKEKFAPVLSFSLTRVDEHQPAFSWYDSSDEVSQVYGESSLQVRQAIPTGGDFSVHFNTSTYDTNERALIINPSHRSSLKFNFSQPLLKDFGPKTARREILIAQNNLAISKKDLQLALEETVYRVEEAFWNLVYSLENLKVRQYSLQLAQDLEERNRKAVKGGTKAAVEILAAQAQVASRKADLLRVEAEVRTFEDLLKLVINLSAENAEADLLRISPQDSLRLEREEMSYEEAVSVALLNRPDLEGLRLSRQNNELQMSFAKNQTLPELNLMASFGSAGVSGTQLIYPSSDPFGDPVAKIPGGRADSLKDVFGFKHPNWSVGLTLNVPFRNVLSRALYAQAHIDLEQTSLRLKGLEQDVRTRIKIALRDVEANFLRIEALKVARELAEKQLAAEEEKFKAGYSSNYFLLQYQGELANQRSQEIRAIVDYNLSLANLKKELGVSLKEKNINLGSGS